MVVSHSLYSNSSSHHRPYHSQLQSIPDKQPLAYNLLHNLPLKVTTASHSHTRTLNRAVLSLSLIMMLF